MVELRVVGLHMVNEHGRYSTVHDEHDTHRVVTITLTLSMTNRNAESPSQPTVSRRSCGNKTPTKNTVAFSTPD